MPATRLESYRPRHSTGDWHILSSIVDHLRVSHHILNGTEGADFFWNRQWPRSVCNYGAEIPSSGLLEATEELDRLISEHHQHWKAYCETFMYVNAET
ncbi:unnamed protein product [Peniophora sp. CBMAI 1063]|nr:unnamed protein product [Peniophora sp. CBMAI 1063]